MVAPTPMRDRAAGQVDRLAFDARLTGLLITRSLELVVVLNGDALRLRLPPKQARELASQLTTIADAIEAAGKDAASDAGRLIQGPVLGHA